jgi:alpha-tubulin suppressor-like RCC1 family protein
LIIDPGQPIAQEQLLSIGSLKAVTASTSLLSCQYKSTILQWTPRFASKKKMNTQKGFSSCSGCSFFITEDDKVLVFGNTEYAALGAVSAERKDQTPPTEVVLPATPHSTSPEIVSLAAGQDFFLALMRDGSVLSWGTNLDGQLGLGFTSGPTEPTLVRFPEEITIKSLHAGCSHSAALAEDGRLFTWGCNSNSQLGLPLPQVHSPTHVPLPSRVIEAASGWHHVLVLTETNDLYAWGSNDDYELGLGDCVAHKSPQKLTVKLTAPVSRIFAGGSRSFILTEEGSLYGWGWYYHGGIGLGNISKSVTIPTLILTRQDICEIACGALHTIILLKNNNLLVWGKNVDGQLGIDGDENANSPVTLQNNFNEDIAGIGAGWNHSWAITTSGNLYLWGCNYHLQLGQPSGCHNRRVPTLFPAKKFKVPWGEWELALRWVFLAKSDRNSIFSGVPIEVIYHFVLIRRYI